MFSANENLALRQHKRRIIAYVEECITEDALDCGTSCMVMQVSCKAPGCVPLETVIMIVFPSSEKELIPGIQESKGGGTYKTKVLMPMAEITKQDVLDALPPPMGTRSMQKLCFQARDVMLAQITQLMGEEDIGGRRIMADYLQTCLEEYKKRDCTPPEYGEPFAEMLEETKKNETNSSTAATENGVMGSKKPALPSGNFVFRHSQEGDGGLNIATMKATTDDAPTNKTTNGTKTEKTTSSQVMKTRDTAVPSSMDWRRQQNVEKELSSQSIISRLSEREHAPGVRMAGCPCCDPDNVANYVDSMMML